jgi:hypothetical protein
MGILFPSLENVKKLKIQPTDSEWCLLNYFIENLPSNIEVYFQPFLNGDMPDIILMHKNLDVTIIEVYMLIIKNIKINFLPQGYM